MLEFPDTIIMQFLADFLLPFCRIAATIGVMVGIGSKTTPTRIKLILALVVTFMAMPAIPPSPFVDLFSFAAIPIIIQQIIIGVIIGFVSTLMLDTFVLAGQIVAMQTGLGFASMMDPVNGMNVPAVGQFYLILATLLFWAIDGHIVLIKMVIYSFDTIPIGSGWLDRMTYQRLFNWEAGCFQPL